MSAWRGELTLDESPARGAPLADEAGLTGCAAAVTIRDDVAEVSGAAPASALLVGVSVGSFEVLVCRGRDTWSLHNAGPDEILDVIRDLAHHP